MATAMVLALLGGAQDGRLSSWVGFVLEGIFRAEGSGEWPFPVCTLQTLTGLELDSHVAGQCCRLSPTRGVGDDSVVLVANVMLLCRDSGDRRNTLPSAIPVVPDKRTLQAPTANRCILL